MPHGAPASARDGWRSFEHRVLTRRAAPHLPRHPRPRREPSLRDGIETWRRPRRIGRFAAHLLVLGLVVLAVADIVLIDRQALHLACLIGAVLLAGAASLLAVAAAEPAGLYPTYARRWQLQAVASALLMFMLMANAADGASADLPWFLIVVGAASTLVAMATSSRDGDASGVRSVCLAVDAGIVGFTAALITIALASPGAPSGGAAVLLGCSCSA
jgi:hypothetical protein